MKKGYSLHVGVRTTAAEHFNDSNHVPLRGCARDAHTMERIARRHRFGARRILIDAGATFHAVERCVRHAAAMLGEGDTFLWSFSGHGARLSVGEPDGYDEGMVLYDYTLLDNHINVLLRRFSAGVRIILVADCCYSATIYEYAPKRKRSLVDDSAGNVLPYGNGEYLNRLISIRAANEHYDRFADHYRRLMERFTREGKELQPYLDADLAMLAACGELEEAADTPDGGVFTNCIADALAGIGNIVRVDGLSSGGLPPGFACDDYAAVHMVGGAFAEAVRSRPDARVFRVAPGDDGTREEPLEARTFA